ncbi:MAG TPA: thiol reductant ABC exporter subunit CydD [Cerasibacillus sp.]|uniref:thiol reductant ABC exporter subunit CydD n=1 Tax=Cerasibacillus sp. TaxID=2498711 RepID=UPI002F42DA1C
MKRQKGLPNYPGSKIVYILLGSLSILEAIGTIAQAIFLARAITYLFKGQALTDVMTDFLFFFIAFILKHSISLLQQYVAEKFAERIGKNLRAELIQTYVKNGRGFVQRLGTGRLVTLAIEGIDNLKNYLTLAIPRIIRTMIIPALIVIYIFTLDKKSAVILIVTVPIVIVFMILLGIAAQKMADSQYATYRVLSNHFIDSLKGLETLKYLGQSLKHEAKVGRVSEQYRKATMRTLRVAFLSSFALDFFTSLSIAFVAVSLGFRLIDGTTDLLPALTILVLAPEYFLPIRQVGKDYHATLDGQVAMDEIDTILAQPIEKERVTKPIKWNSSSTLELKQVRVEKDEHVLLDNISFSCSHHGMVGIVGASGAGKSTLIHVLAGFIKPTNGTMTVNDELVNSFNRDDWLNYIAYIPQHPYIFPMSLADNIRFYDPEATDEQVAKVIEKIGLSSFVQDLPNGIHEKIGEGARELSGGQEQRIAMARALLSKKPILLLDEPTAHLDIETEYEIKQLMLDIFKDKLVFLATHRYHWMKDMDHLLVIDDGRLIEHGTHNELIAKNGHYVNLTRVVN